MLQFIDKSAIVAELETRYNECLKRAKIVNADYWNGCADAYRNMLVVFDTLEVKEVDLEKQIEILDSTLYDLDGVAVKGATSYLTVEDIKDIAKHFFELGLKAQKGE